jgi:hypothetical protein
MFFKKILTVIYNKKIEEDEHQVKNDQDAY